MEAVTWFLLLFSIHPGDRILRLEERTTRTEINSNPFLSKVFPDTFLLRSGLSSDILMFDSQLSKSHIS